MGLEVVVENGLCWMAIFIANVIIDLFAVKFVVEVVKVNPIRAGLMSVGITLVNSMSLILIIEYSHWYIIPTILGAFWGTMAAVTHEQHKKEGSE